MPIVPVFPDVAPTPPAPVVGAWTAVGSVNFIGCTPQTFTTTGAKTVTLSDGSTVTVNATMSVGTITTGTAGADATRGLIADVPIAVASTAYQLRTTVPVSPSIAVTDDLLCVIKWRVNLGTGTNQRGLTGLTSSTGTEGTADFSGLLLQNTATNVVKLQTRKGTSVADTVCVTALRLCSPKFALLVRYARSSLRPIRALSTPGPRPTSATSGATAPVPMQALAHLCSAARPCM
jgi:hypothetical protein